MKRLKEFIELIKNLFIFLLVGFWWVWAILIIVWIYYAISVSDLPPWFKYWLLN